MNWLSGLPALIVGGMAPWISPFLSIDLINNRWRPEIDQVTNGLIAIYVVYLMVKYPGPIPRGEAITRSKRSAILAFLLGLVCYVTKEKFIHWIDPDLIILANIPWSIAYCLAFLAISRAIFFLLAILSRARG